MLLRSFTPLTLAAFAAFDLGGARAAAETQQRISGPHVHDRLALYFIHGADATGKVPLTLAEALAGGKVQVAETGQVNELQIENAGDEAVFIQAGDIVKGGRQDRVLMVSLLLPAHSGKVPIASFCVEAGRWTGRAGEDATRFASAAYAMPSRTALLAMAAPAKPEPSRADPPIAYQNSERSRRTVAATGTAGKQRQVWDSVAQTQQNLSAGLGARVNAPESQTSLQLSLENAALREAQAPYLAAIEAAGLSESDVLGYVAAINGKPVSANVYPSNALFRKVWARQLAAVVTEAIGERTQAAAPAAPSVAEVESFLADAERGKAEERETAVSMRQETRDSERALYNEARSPAGQWVHRSYLAK